MPEAQPEAKQPNSDAFGANAWLVDEMFEEFRRDPLSVSESWREFFEGYKPAGANLAGRRLPVPPVHAPVDEAAYGAPAGGGRNGGGAGVATLTAPSVPLAQPQAAQPQVAQPQGPTPSGRSAGQPARCWPRG